MKNCYCLSDAIMNCGGCGKDHGLITEDEAQDILSALSFFESDYPDRKGSIQTRKAMKKISKKLWIFIEAT